MVWVRWKHSIDRRCEMAVKLNTWPQILPTADLLWLLKHRCAHLQQPVQAACLARLQLQAALFGLGYPH